jgi:transcriptional regulator with XRE-family HTH domain
MIRVKILRKKKGLTQKKLSEILGIDQTAISNWERGKGLPDNTNQLKLANFFNVSLDYLLGRDSSEGLPVSLDASNIDLIKYAADNGLGIEDIIEFIDFVNRLKQKQAEQTSRS